MPMTKHNTIGNADGRIIGEPSSITATKGTAEPTLIWDRIILPASGYLTAMMSDDDAEDCVLRQQQQTDEAIGDEPASELYPPARHPTHALIGRVGDQ